MTRNAVILALVFGGTTLLAIQTPDRFRIAVLGMGLLLLAYVYAELTKRRPGL